jgi:hypothetical protein
MVVLINIGRLAMAAWIVYGLVLIFAPSWLHRPPDQMSGIIQCLLAYALGYLLDRLLGVLRRRRAVRATEELQANDAGGPRTQAD